jgi:hypothetical protein
MKALQLWANDRTEEAVWLYGDTYIASKTKDQYEMMTYTQLLLRKEGAKGDLVEGIKLMLQLHGNKIKKH